ncbi:hypothetical protein [Homoserinibacter sp. YIM 151385]|uniref:hypothetical protein n=1 Tax=Homoserinibacter sp. YIM 151385 TaxID=2985506 RepID=UPI0022F0AFCF|nr:hypothetical protein [Homoserinibacter sp. YIM 151385]WBU37810.1 hypothetical protein OF852_12955 [Homoserinibacter sp. YIM 151385]
MSDDRQWHAPGSPTPPSAAPAPPPPAPGTALPPQPGSGPRPGTPGAAVPAWTPPPKPGLVPLRPMTLGTVLSGSFAVLRRNPGPTLGFSLLLTAAMTVVVGALIGLVTFWVIDRAISAGSSEDADQIALGGVALIAVAGLVSMPISLIVTALVQGVVSLEVASGTLGERLRLAGLWRRIRGRVGALIGWTLLISGAAIVALVLIGVIVALPAIFGGGIGAVVTAFLVAGVIALLLVSGVWLGTRLSMVPSSIVVERLPLRRAVARSWTLTQGYFWRTFGIILLVAAIYSVASQVISAPVSLLGGMAGGLLGSTEDPTTLIVLFIVIYAVTIILSVLVSAVGIVVQSATAALLYLDLRMRKEGLDLELIRVVEERQAGRPVADPYAAREDGPLPADPAAQPVQPSGSPWA